MFNQNLLLAGVSIRSGGSGMRKLPYATCSTGLYTYDKVATITNGEVLTLEPGAVVIVKYTNNPNEAGISTLNVDSTGAKPVKNLKAWTGTEANSSNMAIYSPNSVYMYVYDGQNWNEWSRFYKNSD